jgi:hypothetical protein
MRIVNDGQFYESLIQLRGINLFNFHLELFKALPRRIANKISEGYLIVANALFFRLVPNDPLIFYGDDFYKNVGEGVRNRSKYG